MAWDQEVPMPWKECSAMSMRLEFVELAMAAGANVSLLCERFRVSRKTGYKWIARYRSGGAAALSDRSRRPRTSPARATDAAEAAVVALRAKHPAWGGRKLAARLRATGAGTAVPAPSTVTAVLRRHGLLDPAGSAARRAPVRFEHPNPNDLWQMDFKGHVAMSAGGRCHPLTVLDDHSRYSVLLAACDDERDATVRGHLTAAFRRYGLPARMLMDNGAPWGCGGYAALSPWTRLTVWLARLGVASSHGRPNHPQTQGKEERFHRTLKAELLRWRPFADLADAQAQLDPWRHTYNHERPHEALGLGVPAGRYRPSPRPFPEALPAVEYGPDAVVRKVDGTGRLHFRGRALMAGSALAGERVALRPTRDDGLWDVFYCQQRLGRVDLRAGDAAGSRLARCRPLDPLADAADAG
jgi:transposase InsO family protein